jgi:hypothetical protein
VIQWQHYLVYLRAATAFDVVGTDNAGGLDTSGFQYPLSSISIFHFVARIFGHKGYSFALLNAGDSGKHQNRQALFTRVKSHIISQR